MTTCFSRCLCRQEMITKMNYGGLILDKIQEKFRQKSHGRSIKFLGMPDLGEECNRLQSFKYQIANHITQFMFHGLTGFRLCCPLSHYSGQCAKNIYYILGCSPGTSTVGIPCDLYLFRWHI